MFLVTSAYTNKNYPEDKSVWYVVFDKNSLMRDWVKRHRELYPHNVVKHYDYNPETRMYSTNGVHIGTVPKILPVYDLTGESYFAYDLGRVYNAGA